jgi:ribosomal protein S6--L-glutamate ligase
MPRRESNLLRIGVLSNESSWYWLDLLRAAPPTHQLQLLTFSTLTARLDHTPTFASIERDGLEQLDVLLVRTMAPGSLEQVIFRMNILHRLAAAGVRVINPPRALEVAVDKYLASALLHDAGLRVPRMRVSQSWEAAMDDFTALGGHVVVKPIFGSEGRGLIRVDDESMAWRVFKTYAQLGYVIYQQEFIEHEGCDLRVMVLGDRCLGMRRCNPTDWRTNVSRGATTEPLELTEAMCDAARCAARAVGAPLAGVDLLPGRDGQLYVLEVNAVPGWRALARTLNVDVAAMIHAWLA